MISIDIFLSCTFFSQKENIEKFLKFCEDYGVKDRFSTPYLYQKQNVMAVRTYSITVFILLPRHNC